MSKITSDVHGCFSIGVVSFSWVSHGFQVFSRLPVDPGTLNADNRDEMQSPVIFRDFIAATPQKTNMEPENHPFKKENDLPNLHFGVPC